MLEILSRLRSSRPARYVFIGGVSYVIELATLLFLARIFSPGIAVACSFWVGLIISFVLQKSIAFGSKTTTKKAFGKQAVLYGILVLFNYIFTIIFVGFLAKHLEPAMTRNMALTTARTLALLLTVSWNYLAYKEIFRQDPN